MVENEMHSTKPIYGTIGDKLKKPLISLVVMIIILIYFAYTYYC